MKGSGPTDGNGSSPAAISVTVRPAWHDEGEIIQGGGNRPLMLDDPSRVWLVEAGRVDLFAVPIREGKVVGARRHLFRVGPGQLLFGMQGTVETGLALLASGSPTTRFRGLQLGRLQGLSESPERREEVLGLLEEWVGHLSMGAASDLPPTYSQPIEPGQTLNIAADQGIRSRRGIAWLTLHEGELAYLGNGALGHRPDLPPLPISVDTWVRAVGAVTLSAHAITELCEQGTLWEAVEQFHRLILSESALSLQRFESSERERLRRKAQADQQVLERAYTNLASVLDRDPIPAAAEEGGAPGDDALFLACQLVGDALEIVMKAPPPADSDSAPLDPLAEIAKASCIRTRQVILKGEWWRNENGPLLGYLADSRAPVALLPDGRRGYLLVNPETMSRTPIDEALAGTLASFAVVFYRPLPLRPLRGWDLVRYGMFGNRRDLLTIALMGVASGLVGLTLPLATAFLFNTLIPYAARPGLLQVGLGLVVSALVMATFWATQNIALLRVESRTDAMVQAAIWDRLLALPTTFFRGYTAGDLGERAMGISQIRRIISGTVISSVLVAIFSLFNLGLLLAYDLSLALSAIALVTLFVVVALAIGVRQVQLQRHVMALQGDISGLVLQFIMGIAKFRVAGAEGRAFAHWAKKFVQQRRAAYQAGMVINSLQVWNAIFPIITSIALFALVARRVGGPLTTGEFLAFVAALNQLLLAGIAVSGAFRSLLGVVPLYERARPILHTAPEVDDAKSHPGRLSGAIEVSHVTFRYRSDGPPVLHDVSLQIRPGEFVALVGPSGSGKSTLLRLLLGFEQPEAGAIYYDGQDLAMLDIREVRRQLGVVLQSGKLMPDDIYHNIIGSAPLSVEDAWAAARLAGLDEDIRRLPMGMHTIVSEGGATFSGGQRQRLLIARAVVNKPRILFFDEATSALDNRTQAVVSDGLAALQATRVVIAHRLSTVINADRIFVLVNGRLVQSGTFGELIQQEGVFADLARRQMV